MTAVWTTIGVLALVSPAIKATGPVLVGGRELPGWATRIIALLAPALAELTGALAAPHVALDRLPEAAHNISLGWAARSDHLRALGFLEECLIRRASAAGHR